MSTSYSTQLTNYLARSPRTIVLRGERAEAYREAAAMSSGIKPGHLLELVNNSGAEGVQKASSYFGMGHRAFAIEDALQGLTIDDAYTSGDPVRYLVVHAGYEILARAPAAAPAILVGDNLISNGDGTVIKAPLVGGDLLYTNTAASAAVTATASATAFDKSYTLPANSLQAGDVIRIKGQGIATATNSTDTLSIAVKIGSTTILTLPALDVANNDIFEFDITMIIRTVGASGTFVAACVYNIGTPGTATDFSQFKASTAVDTTATQALTVVATWSTNNSGNSCRLDVLTVTRPNTGAKGYVGKAIGALDNSAGVSEAFLPILTF